MLYKPIHSITVFFNEMKYIIMEPFKNPDNEVPLQVVVCLTFLAQFISLIFKYFAFKHFQFMVCLEYKRCVSQAHKNYLSYT
jgi:hypothetical protein